MRYSRLFGKSLRSVACSVQPEGNRLLYQAGFIRESASGRYHLLPLGMRSRDRICRIVEAEMTAAGVQKIITPVLHPLSLWQETRRDSAVSFELMRLADRRGRMFVLGGTAEEMVVDLVRGFDISHRDLPLAVFQFSQKFRDELRSRGGLLRTREFLMKDAYSFHASKEDFELFYEQMEQAYRRIFERLGLDAEVVAADNGYMGGEYSHEFVVEHEAGESRYLLAEDGSYAAHEDVARFDRGRMNADEAVLPFSVVSVEAAAGWPQGIPDWRQLKSRLFVAESGEFILAVIRGDLALNEAKLLKAAGTALQPASESDVGELGGTAGCISVLLSGVRKIGDLSLQSVVNFQSWAAEAGKLALHLNYGRDFSVDTLADIASAPEGACTEDGAKRLTARTGIEVGNIFQLGTYYTERMDGAVYTGSDGRRHCFYMGCYGIGIDRTLAAIAELHHDERGLEWPSSAAPYDLQLVALGKDKQGQAAAEELYQELLAAGVAVLFDDRQVSAGVKFADADLIGLPHRVVVASRTLQSGLIEYRGRSDESSRPIALDELLQIVGRNTHHC